MESREKKIVKNSLFLLSRVIFLTIISLYTLREVLNALGQENFGLFNLVFGVVAMFTFINGAMMAATQRYLGFEIGKNNVENIKNTFITSLFIHIILAFLLSIFIFILKDTFLNNILNVDQYKKEAEIIYFLAMVSIVISILQVPFSALITAYEKMQAFAYLALFEGVAKLLVVFLLNNFNYNKVIFYSALLTSITFIVFTLHIFYSYLNFPKVLEFFSTKLSKIKSQFGGMLNFMGWSLIGNLSVVMRNHGANILLNIFFGVLVNAAFAIAMTMMGALSSLVSSISNAINPQIFKKYAENNLDEFFNLISYGTKYYIYMISLVVFPLIFCMDIILSLWLKNPPQYVLIFCSLALILVLIESFSTLIISAIQATGEIKGTQIVVGSLLLMNLPISYIFFKQGLPATYIFYTYIGISFVAFFVRIWFLIKITQYSFYFYMKIVFLPSIFLQALICLSILIWIYILGKPSDIYSLLIFLFVTGLSNISLLYILGLSKNEKLQLRNMVNKGH